MSDKLPHFDPGTPNVWRMLNKLVDKVNDQDDEIKDLREQLAAKPAPAKRAVKSTASAKE